MDHVFTKHGAYTCLVDNLECSPISWDSHCDDFSKVQKLGKISGHSLTILLNCFTGASVLYRECLGSNSLNPLNFITWFDVTVGGLHKYTLSMS